MNRKKGLGVQKKVFFVLVVLVLSLSVLNIIKAKGLLIPKQGPVDVKHKVVDLTKMTLEQKIAQMVVVVGTKENYWPWRNMQLGGIHLFARQTEHVFNNTIIDFQYQSPIPFFVTADLEGCVSPFGFIRQFTPASEIATVEEAFEKGIEEGQFLRRLGFNMNFAPVVDLKDDIWKCRSFPGNETEISALAQAYITGLQTESVLATAKHYPGKTLIVKDPHKYVVAAEIGKKDVYPYTYLEEKGEVKAIMVSHIITSGEIDSGGVPSVVSKKVLDGLRQDFDGLIVSDEIHMLGLKKFYNSVDEMYVAVFKAGNDVVLNFDKDPNEIYHMIQVVKAAVERGEIPEAQIDASVGRILEAKGFTVV
ncbi:MAG: glycoside hydrolase family 3 N-terminal domain-containing protein [Nanoarchaeota archaeon]|nr:glycoside hydrolase family 3 N-terminal domain-containing protein [Nanoarchaeota archaeon]